MIPTNGAFNKIITTAQQPSRTYRVDLERHKIRGMTDGQEAMRQLVYKILNTERYQYVIYSWNYGVELSDLLGQPVTYVLPELKRRITEALMVDDRIKAVDGFDFEVTGRTVKATFTVNTVYGDLAIEKAVEF